MIFYPFFIFVVHFNLNYCNGIVSIQMGEQSIYNVTKKNYGMFGRIMF